MLAYAFDNGELQPMNAESKDCHKPILDNCEQVEIAALPTVAFVGLLMQHDQFTVGEFTIQKEGNVALTRQDKHGKTPCLWA